MSYVRSFLTAAILLFSLSIFAATKKKQEKVVVAYVTSWSHVLPDPTTMTHINYAFGHVTKTFDGVRIDNEDRLRKIVALKKQCPQLKVLLSVGGWGSGNFSEMAASETLRKAFAKDCQRVVKEFNLDGIDIDWEYPGQNSAGISSSPQDEANFTLLMRDLRNTLGKHLLVTCATVSNCAYYDIEHSHKYMDFINIMSYDMANPPHHHSALYRNKLGGWCTVQEAVEAHLKHGVPASKLVLGMPFYGRGENAHYFRTHDTKGGHLQERWDDFAQVPYLVNSEGKMVLGFDNPRSLAAKCQYALDQGLLGAMYWEYSDDNTQGDLRRTLYLSILQNQKATLPAQRVLVVAERGGDHEGFVEASTQWLQKKAPEWNVELTSVSSLRDIPVGELDKYHLILLLNYPPFAWSDAAVKDFQRYIEEGHGGFIGFHHATLLGEFEGFPLWKWFSDFMGGIRFKGYIAGLADGSICVEDTEHPIFQGIPSEFTLSKDEWYTYDKNPRSHVHVLAHVDEHSYQPSSDIRMGDHPVIWTNPRVQARNVYFQFGHHRDLLKDDTFCHLFENAILWTLGK